MHDMPYVTFLDVVRDLVSSSCLIYAENEEVCYER